MKIAMRLNKNQVPAYIKKNSGSGHIDKRLHVMAGYTKFECMIIGAAGGFSGRCNSAKGYTVYEYGGGGGGSLQFSGTLESLADLTPYSVGKQGAGGSDRGDNRYGEDGAKGGDSSFADKIAYGGAGGQGGMINRRTGTDQIFRGRGGNGGLNNAGMGVAGVGQQGVNGSRDHGTAGTWESSVDIAGGGGGGGGPGLIVFNGDNRFWSANGGNGASGSGTTVASGQDFGNFGGCGGGADIQGVLGTQEWYGTRPIDPDGVVIIRFS